MWRFRRPSCTVKSDTPGFDILAERATDCSLHQFRPTSVRRGASFLPRSECTECREGKEKEGKGMGGKETKNIPPSIPAHDPVTVTANFRRYLQTLEHGRKQIKLSLLMLGDCLLVSPF